MIGPSDLVCIIAGICLFASLIAILFAKFGFIIIPAIFAIIFVCAGIWSILQRCSE